MIEHSQISPSLLPSFPSLVPGYSVLSLPVRLAPEAYVCGDGGGWGHPPVGDIATVLFFDGWCS